MTGYCHLLFTIHTKEDEGPGLVFMGKEGHGCGIKWLLYLRETMKTYLIENSKFAFA